MEQRQYSQEEIEKMLLAYRDLLIGKQYCEEALKGSGDPSFAHQSRFLRNLRKFREAIPPEIQPGLAAGLGIWEIGELEEICEMNRDFQ